MHFWEELLLSWLFRLGLGLALEEKGLWLGLGLATIRLHLCQTRLTWYGLTARHEPNDALKLSEVGADIACWWWIWYMMLNHVITCWLVSWMEHWTVSYKAYLIDSVCSVLRLCDIAHKTGNRYVGCLDFNRKAADYGGTTNGTLYKEILLRLPCTSAPTCFEESPLLWRNGSLRP